MKTNKILLAMALPVAFAACTSEEIIENASVNLQSRKVLPEITVTVDNGVDSRFSWNETNFGWNAFTANDKFGAGLVDGTPWNVGDNLYTNYIYSDAAGNGAFTTTSQMVEGVYFFYSYPDFESVAKRGTVAFDLTSQTAIDFENPTAAVEENQLFVSALYKLDAETANEALPVKFYSYWSTAGLKLKNTSGAPIKIVRVMLKNAGDEKFDVKGTLKLTNMGTADAQNNKIAGYCYSYDAASGEYVLGYKNVDKTADGRVDEDGFLTLNIAQATISDDAMMFDCGKYELADGEEALAYFQVPAGNYTDLEVIVNVEVEEEDPFGDFSSVIKELEPIKVAKNAKSEDDAAENDITAFRRGKTVALFGIANNAIAAEEIDDVDILAAGDAGYYAADYDDLSALVKGNNENFEVNNMGTLKIDDKVVRLMSSVNNVVTFNNPIEITTEKTAAVALKNIKVVDATIVKGKFVVNEDLEGCITVDAGTELTVKLKQTGTIKNYGTVNLEKASAVNSMTKENNVDYNSVVNVISDVTIDQDVIVGAPKTLKVTGASSEKTATAAISGKVTVPNLEVNANGVIKDESKNLTITGTVTNAGEINGTNLVGKKVDKTEYWATVENSGVIDGMALNQYAKITNMNSNVAAANNVTGYTVDGEITYGCINNTLDGFVEGAEGETVVYVEYDGVDKSGKLGAVQGCNKVILKNATWTKPEFYSNNITEVVLDNVILTDGDKNETPIDDGTDGYDWSNIAKAAITDSEVKISMELSGAGKTNFEGTVFSKKLNADKATETNIVGAEFNGDASLGGLSDVKIDLTDVTVNATMILPKKITDVNVGYADGTAASTAVNAKISGPSSVAITVLKNATLSIGLDGSIGENAYWTGEGKATNKNSNYTLTNDN